MSKRQGIERRYEQVRVKRTPYDCNPWHGHDCHTSGLGKPRSSEDPQDMERTSGHGSPRPRDEPQDMSKRQGIERRYEQVRVKRTPYDCNPWHGHDCHTSGLGKPRPRDEPQDMERNSKIFGRQGGFFGGRKTSEFGKPRSSP